MALKVVGAGLGRTGTMSLKLALELEHLGMGPCYHMLEIMAHASQRMPQWISVVRGTPDWDAIFDGFASTVDYPTATYWRELSVKYPEAKVVLSDRDADDWYDSVRETIFSPKNVDRILNSPAGEFMLGAVMGPFVDHLDDRAYMVDYFNRWHEDVIAALPAERLLVHRSKEGWKPLCAFLGVPVPAEPYPRVNTKESMQARHQSAYEEGRNASPASPEAMEASAQAYVANMIKQAWG